ncbi:MAG: DUF1566 domain-containing protein, partial [Crocinitomicaceae bacterium]|nr:DUF1566 domain-containing protein [Crocinitomicaceae bacterium]
IGGLVDAPTLGTDATNKDYVDAAVSAGGGGSLPTMISDESSTTMDYGSAMRYCRNLTEATFSDWHLPTFEEISYIYSKGGTSVSNENSSNYVWTVAQGVSNGYSNRIQSIRFSDGVNSYNSGSALIYVRCVR